MRRLHARVSNAQRNTHFKSFMVQFVTADCVEHSTLARYSGLSTLNQTTQRFQGTLTKISHDHKHGDHEHHGNQPPRTRPIHHKWWFWAAVFLMLGPMVTYVMTMDEAIGPGGKGQEMPAAAP